MGFHKRSESDRGVSMIRWYVYQNDALSDVFGFR